MQAGVAERPADSAAVDDFLTTLADGPSALVLDGEAGIGKTTLWLTSLERARTWGFRVLSARPAAAESVLAYASLADLLGGIDDADWASLPDPQRIAMDRVLLRTSDDAIATDQHAVAAGFLSIVNRLVSHSPVLIAIDDMQWLDPSSAHVVAFAARRLKGRIGVLVTLRSDADGANAPSWLQLPRPDGVRRFRLGALSIGALHSIIAMRLGRSIPRPMLVRIYEISGGNPLYAIELARGLDRGSTLSDVVLPETLTELVRARIGALDPDSRDVLLAAACVAAPTVDVVARAVGTPVHDIVQHLEDAEAKGIVAIEGNRLRFAHPLLARGVHDHAEPARRRWMHRRLAAIVEQPELRARHLAMAGVFSDPATLAALDDAAETARRRGAPAAAAELVDLALRLGGDTPARRINSARYHLDAGDLQRARQLLQATIEGLAAGTLRDEALQLLATVSLFDASYFESIDLLTPALADPSEDRPLRAQMLVTLALSYLNTGDLAAAARQIEDAASEATRLGHTQLLSQALGIRVLVGFVGGDGFDQPTMQQALELEDHTTAMAGALRPSLQNALLLACTGQLEQAHTQMASVRRSCLDRGEESELVFAAFYSAVIEIWRGNFIAAAHEADDSLVRALQLGGDMPLFGALMIRAALATYAGDVAQARRDAADALAAGQRCGATTLMPMVLGNLAFLDLSLGDYAAALTTVVPLLAGLEATPRASEILVAHCVPDAAEALIMLGRLTEAEPLIDRLEQNGRRLDRVWMLAVGARCRAMLLAARGDLAAAGGVAQQAMAHHDRLAMPFERARTQLLLGQLHRRLRQKNSAATTLSQALQAFEAMGTRLWAERARLELARTNVAANSGHALTPTEQRVAELAASGMTNRDVAAALFISPKTVEVNLSRVYRKLDIHSRAQLGQRMAQPEARHE